MFKVCVATTKELAEKAEKTLWLNYMLEHVSDDNEVSVCGLVLVEDQIKEIGGEGAVFQKGTERYSSVKKAYDVDLWYFYLAEVDERLLGGIKGVEVREYDPSWDYPE